MWGELAWADMLMYYIQVLRLVLCPDYYSLLVVKTKFLGTWCPTLLCATMLFVSVYVLGWRMGVEGDFWFSILCG